MIKTDIQGIIRELATANPEIIIGWEKLSNLGEEIDRFDERGIQQYEIDPSIVARAINEQTDYLCIVAKHSLVIVPNAGPSVHDQPLVLRQCASPDAANVAIANYLPTISGADSMAPVSLGIDGSGSNLYGRIEGTVTMSEGRAAVYARLTTMARQIGAKRWIVLHMIFTDPSTESPIRPHGLAVGTVRFER